MEAYRDIISLFIGMALRYPYQFSLLFIALLVEGGVASISVLSIVPLSDYIIDHNLLRPSRVTVYYLEALSGLKVSPGFEVFGGFFVLVNILRGVVEVGIKYIILKIKYIVIRGLFGDALETFLNAKWSFFSQVDNSKLLSALDKEINTIGDALEQIATVFVHAIQLFIYLSIPIALNPTMTIVAIVLSCIFAMPLAGLHTLGYKYGKQTTESGHRAIGLLSEIIQMARIIISYGRQKEALLDYLSTWDEHTASALRSQGLIYSITPLFRPLGMFAAIVSMGIALRLDGNISELAAMLWSLLAALPIIGHIIKGRVSISNFLPSYEQILNLTKDAVRYEEGKGFLVFNGLQDEIRFENVRFQYEQRQSPAVQDLTLIIKKGEMTALVGASGSGKSTVVDLLLGLQNPSFGEILVDNIQIDFFDKMSYRRKVGYVPQDPILFNKSIRDNLAWAQDNLTEVEAWEALRMANAYEFVRDLPLGLDTIVGERGMWLSGGQRQRIALARALVRRPDLLVLDEATSALDSESEYLIQNAIEKIVEHATVFVIAHRISTISRANSIYVLREGKIIESGSYGELSKLDGGILNRSIKLQSGENQHLSTEYNITIQDDSC